MPSGASDPTRRKLRREIPPRSPDAPFDLSMTVPRSCRSGEPSRTGPARLAGPTSVVVSEFARVEKSTREPPQGRASRGLPADERFQLGALPLGRQPAQGGEIEFFNGLLAGHAAFDQAVHPPAFLGDLLSVSRAGQHMQRLS